MTTLDQVEKLRVMANITYGEAKAALDSANWDLLEAIIILEKQGKITTPTGGGYYSSERTEGPSAEGFTKNGWEKQNKHCKSKKRGL